MRRRRSRCTFRWLVQEWRRGLRWKTVTARRPPCMCATALSTCRCRRARSPSIAEHLMEKPRLRFGQLWNMNLGFFGIQFGWGLQMANMSAIYEYLGARPDQIPLLWLAAPLTGLIVQPIIGEPERPHLGQAGTAAPLL